MKIAIKVQPRASKEEVVEGADGALKIYLKQAPVDGKANKALIEILAKHYKTKKHNIKIVTGHASRNKIIEIAIEGDKQNGITKTQTLKHKDS